MGVLSRTAVAGRFNISTRAIDFYHDNEIIIYNTEFDGGPVRLTEQQVWTTQVLIAFSMILPDHSKAHALRMISRSISDAFRTEQQYAMRVPGTKDFVFAVNKRFKICTVLEQMREGGWMIPLPVWPDFPDN